MNSISILDILILLSLVASGIIVSSRGFFHELGSKASYFIGILVGLMFTKRLSVFVSEHTDLNYGLICTYLSFFTLFLIGAILCRLFSTILENALDGVKLSNLSRVMGFALGILEGFIVLLFILWVLKFQTIIDINEYLNKSIIYNNIINPFAAWISNSGIIEKVAEVKNNVVHN